MTKFFKAGEAIHAHKVFYCFGTVPTSAAQAKGKYRGTFSRNGYARETVPLRRNYEGKPVTLNEVHCETAAFECRKSPKLPGRKMPCSGSHTCFTGYLREDAKVKIKTPFRHHAQ